MSVTAFLGDLVKSIYVSESGTVYIRMFGTSPEGSTPSGFVPDELKESILTTTGGNTAVRNISTEA